MLERGATAALNHVLAQHPWARARLGAFAGKTVVFRCPPLPELAFGILESGLLSEVPAAPEPALTVSLAPSTLPLLVLRDQAALKNVKIEGSAELADAVRSLFAHLSWDAEEDLSLIFGDALARRIASNGEAFVRWQRDAAVKFGENLAEYWKEEQPLLARPADVDAFCREVDALRDDVARLEKRLDLLRPATPAASR